jgi:hypothetical protein
LHSQGAVIDKAGISFGARFFSLWGDLIQSSDFKYFVTGNLGIEAKACMVPFCAPFSSKTSNTQVLFFLGCACKYSLFLIDTFMVLLSVFCCICFCFAVVLFFCSAGD